MGRAEVEAVEGMLQVATEGAREELARVRADQQDREKGIAEAYELAGRIQAFSLVRKMVTVSELIQLRRAKESKVYRHMPGVGTWENYCEYLGLDRHTIDQYLLSLDAFGEEFMVHATNLQVGLRDLRKLRHAASDGQLLIEGETVQIGDERIPLTPDHREDLQHALEDLLHAKQELLAEKDAVIRAKDKVLEAKEQVIQKQEKELQRLETAAAGKGLTPTEDAFLLRVGATLTAVENLLGELDPDRSPLPADATPRMCAALMEALGRLRRIVHAVYDTAAEQYGIPELDDDWQPQPAPRTIDPNAN